MTDNISRCVEFVYFEFCVCFRFALFVCRFLPRFRNEIRIIFLFLSAERTKAKRERTLVGLSALELKFLTSLVLTLVSIFFLLKIKNPSMAMRTAEKEEIERPHRGQQAIDLCALFSSAHAYLSLSSHFVAAHEWKKARSFRVQFLIHKTRVERHWWEVLNSINCPSSLRAIDRLQLICSDRRCVKPSQNKHDKHKTNWKQMRMII